MKLFPLSPQPARSDGTRRRLEGWWPLAVIASAHLMAVVDTTIMFVALPSIQHGLHMTDASRQWVVTAYTLALAGLLLLGGRLADRLGARRTLIIGVVGGTGASTLGGASVDGAMLIAARAIQGAFAAVLVSSTKALLVTVYKESRGPKCSASSPPPSPRASPSASWRRRGDHQRASGWRWCLYLNVVCLAFSPSSAFRECCQLPPRPEVRIDLASVALRLGRHDRPRLWPRRGGLDGVGFGRVVSSLGRGRRPPGRLCLPPVRAHLTGSCPCGWLPTQPRLGDGGARCERPQHLHR